MFSNGPLQTDVQVFGDQQEVIYRKRWSIETNSERKSGKSELAVQHCFMEQKNAALK